MSRHIAKRAVVVGAGMGGLAAAGALAPYFEEVVVLERDELVVFEVRHLLKPQAALSEPWLTERLTATAEA